MKKFNWLALPGILIGIYFIYIGLTIITSNLVFACIWLIITGMGCYRSFKIFLRKSEKSPMEVESKTAMRLKELDSLYDQGLITREELEENRKKILNEV